jgi:hypothetical protein
MWQSNSADVDVGWTEGEEMARRMYSGTTIITLKHGISDCVRDVKKDGSRWWTLTLVPPGARHHPSVHELVECLRNSRWVSRHRLTPNNRRKKSGEQTARTRSTSLLTPKASETRSFPLPDLLPSA